MISLYLFIYVEKFYWVEWVFNEVCLKEILIYCRIINRSLCIKKEFLIVINYKYLLMEKMWVYNIFNKIKLDEERVLNLFFIDLMISVYIFVFVYMLNERVIKLE